MNKIHIRAWTSKDGWYIGADPRLVFEKSFTNYGIWAKLNYLYAKIFYQKVVIDIRDKDEGEI